MQSTLTTLQEIDANVSGDQSSADAIGRKLFDEASEIHARITDDTRLLTTSPSLDMVYRLKLIWRRDDQLRQVPKRRDDQAARSPFIARGWSVFAPQVECSASTAGFFQNPPPQRYCHAMPKA